MIMRIAKVKDIEIISLIDKHISKNELENIINLKRAYIFEEEDKFIGWLRYNLFWDNTPFINMLYILDEYRGQGFGRLAVEFLEEELKSLGHKTLLTSTASNEYAQHFYNKLGYKTIGGFTLGEDPFEIILSKNIEKL